MSSQLKLSTMYDPFNRNDHQKIDLKHCYNSFEYPEDGQNGQESQAVNRFLERSQWPISLCQAYIQHLKHTAKTIFLCDDSGSMNASCAPDGDDPDHTRWMELVQSLSFHAELAHIAQSPTEFRFLNGPVINVGITSSSSSLDMLVSNLRRCPSGSSPLCHHIRQIATQVSQMDRDVRSHGQHMFIVIATDGEASDGDVLESLRLLNHLSVRVIVRLCSDDQELWNYWLDIRRNFDLDMDIIPSMYGYDQDIKCHRKAALNTEPFYRLKELGCLPPEIDKLTLVELSQSPSEQDIGNSHEIEKQTHQTHRHSEDDPEDGLQSDGERFMVQDIDADPSYEQIYQDKLKLLEQSPRQKTVLVAGYMAFVMGLFVFIFVV